MAPALNSLLDDPDLGSVSFSVIRSTATLSGGEVHHSSVTLPAVGIVQPGGLSRSVSQPGEDKGDTSLTVYTRFPLTAGSDDGTTVTLADEILYQFRNWRVTAVRDWSAEGFYVATCDLVKDVPNA